MKNIYLFFIALLTVCASLKGQVAVTATSGAFSGSYPTLKAAFDAINNGDHQGAINIRINASTTEVATARLNASGGTAHYSRIHIRPTLACTISGNIAGPLIELNGADSITFEGRVGGIGTVRSLTIRNLYYLSNSFGNTSTIKLCNSARANKLRYLNLEGASQGYYSGTVYIGYGSNSYNIIENNDIGPAGGKLPSVAIHALPDQSYNGPAGAYNVIADNMIHDFFSTTDRSSGILIDSYNTNTTISGNSIYMTTPVTGQLMFVLSFIGIGEGTADTIRNNFIGGSAPLAGGGPAVFNEGISILAINAGSRTYDTSVIEGNVVRNFQLNNNAANRSAMFEGIRASGMPAVKITGNTVGSPDSTGNITVSYTGPVVSGLARVAGINVEFGSIYRGAIIADNTVGGLTLNGAAAENARIQGIIIATNSNTIIERNIIGGQVPGSLQLNAGSGTVEGISMTVQGSGYQYTCRQNIIRHLYNNCSGTTDAIVRGIYTFLQRVEGTDAACYITGNRITHLHNTASSALNGSVQGVYNNAEVNTIKAFVNSHISGNTIDTLSSETNGYTSVVMGIGSQGPHNRFLDIDSNTIHTLFNAAPNTNTVSTAAVQGIGTNLPYKAPVNVIGNKIYDLESATAEASTVIGVNSAHKSNLYAYTLSKNQIYDLRKSNSGTGVVLGVSLRGTSGTGRFLSAII